MENGPLENSTLEKCPKCGKRLFITLNDGGSRMCANPLCDLHIKGKIFHACKYQIIYDISPMDCKICGFKG